MKPAGTCVAGEEEATPTTTENLRNNTNIPTHIAIDVKQIADPLFHVEQTCLQALLPAAVHPKS